MQRQRILITSCTVLLVPGLASSHTVEYAHLDALGNIRAVTDHNGAVIERHDFLPFGEEWNPQPGNQALRFTGKERDTETGFDYFGARYYQVKWGRFTTVDPALDQWAALVDPHLWNRCAYGRNNPLRYVDPDGRQAVPQPGTLDSIIAYFYRVLGLNYQPAVVMQEGQRPQTVGMADKEPR